MDYRKNQKVVATIEIEDKGQDFIELDLLQNGVILGTSPLFREGRLSLVGIGTANGSTYYTREQVVQTRAGVLKVKGMFVYFKESGQKDPLPWKAKAFKYAVTKIKKAQSEDRFITKNSHEEA